MLDGITVLDLASVGPAARASRWLADYGATVVKVGPVPAGQRADRAAVLRVQRAPRHERVLLDLKAPDGREAFLAWPTAPTWSSRASGPASSTGSASATTTSGRATRGIVYCSTTGYGQDGPRAQWAGHDLNYLAVGGFLDCSGRGADGGPPIPGATVADSAGGGMHAVIAILAALVRPQRDRRGRVPRRVGGRRRPRADGAADRRVPRHRRRAGPGPRHAHRPLRLLRHLRARPTAGGSPSPPSSRASGPTSAALLGLEQWTDHQTDDAVQDEIRADLRAAFATRDRDDEWIDELAPADTCVAPVLSVPELVDDPQFNARARSSTLCTRPWHVPAGRADARGDGRPAGRIVSATDVTDTDDLLAPPGCRRDVRRASARGVVA